MFITKSIPICGNPTPKKNILNILNFLIFLIFLNILNILNILNQSAIHLITSTICGSSYFLDSSARISFGANPAC